MLVEDNADNDSILNAAMEKIGCGSQDERDDSNFNSDGESPLSEITPQTVTTTSEVYSTHSPRFQPSRQHHDSEAYFRNLLSDPEGYKSFRRFVEGRFSDANIRFWGMCEQFRKTSPIECRRLHDLLTAINERFLRRQANYRVSLNKRALEEIRAATRFGSPVSVHLFDNAQEEIFQQMLECEYQEYLESLDAVSDADTNVSLGSHSGYSNYPPYPSKPSSTICDSSSTFSVGSDPGTAKRNQGQRVLRRPVSSNRSTVSDTDTLPMTKVRMSKKVASQEEFVAQITERLYAVKQDREKMKKEVQEMTTNKLSDGEVLDWYDHPGARRYHVPETSGVRNMYPSGTSGVSDHRSHLRHAQAPVRTPLKSQRFDDSTKDLDSSMNDLHIRPQQKQRMYMGPMSDITDSGIYSDSRERQTTSNGYTRVLNYVQGQQNLQDRASERELEAQHAATILINNAPAIDHPVLPYGFADWDLMSKGHGSGPAQYSPPGQSSYHRSSDDSTSVSSGSHLFVPRQNRDASSESERSHIRYSRHPRTSSGQRRSRHGASNTENNLLILYYLDTEQIPYTHKVEDRDITLGEFKETVFKRQGEFRFFFNEWNEEVNTEVRSEYSCDDSLLPRCNNRISGKIERITC